MKISDILAVKGRRIVTVNHHLRADAIPQRFDENGISSLLVVDGTGRPSVSSPTACSSRRWRITSTASPTSRPPT